MRSAKLPCYRGRENSVRRYTVGDKRSLYLGDFSEVSAGWPSPTVIVADGPYGVASYPGDPVSHEELAEWYSPHVDHWSERALPETTLWFWNTEIGWATVHPVLAQHGWEYRSCHVWDKGIGHIAGNANSKTLRRFPVVTEVCVQYVRRVTVSASGQEMGLKEWVRHEWERSGLTFNEANLACGVKNAATRKYLTKCHLWYFPPPEAFELLAQYAHRHGRPEGRPYLQPGRHTPATAGEWARMRAKFPLRRRHHHRLEGTAGTRRRAYQGRIQKRTHEPEAASPAGANDTGVIRQGRCGVGTLGGLCSTAIAALNTGRQCYSAEILEDYYRAAVSRLANHEPPSLMPPTADGQSLR